MMSTLLIEKDKKMIDKKTRNNIGIILLKRRKKLGQKSASALTLYEDLNWLMLHSGQITDELVDDGFLKEK